MRFLKTNLTVIMYFIFAMIIEMIAVFSIEKSPFISYPWIGFGLLLIISGVMIGIKSEKAKIITGLIFLIIQSLLCMIVVVLFDMAGQYFDFGMLNLRNDAFGILENIPMNFVMFYTAFFFCTIYVVVNFRRYRRKEYKLFSKKKRMLFGGIVTVVGISLLAVSLYHLNKTRAGKYENLRYSTDNSVYNAYGITGNLVNEFAGGLIFTDKDNLSDSEVEDFIYSEISDASDEYGISKDNNVVVILVESLEWFGFMKNEYLPNALPLTDEQYAELFPNLTMFYNESIVMTDFHSKEKTDISETMSILGSYPTTGYINYDYYEEEIPETIPNILNQFYGDDIKISSFHNGKKNFYNRDKAHISYGFSEFCSSEEMYKMNEQKMKDENLDKEIMHDYMSEGERNLDSEMIELCKDKMFPKDKRFFTYITSITMHGMYYERENLADNKKKLLAMLGKKSISEEDAILIDYLTTVMDFDKSLGIMMEDLDNKGILDNTTVVLFGDHNCYYQWLSNYVKDIYDYDTSMNYSDLYRVPFMIYDKKVGHRVIDKYTCTSDIAPTIMDLLGIRYFSNLYYGHSVFSKEESVIYSRAYNFFVDDGIVAKSLSRPLYRAADVTDKDWDDFVERGDFLIEKLEYCDQIFTNKFFSRKDNKEKFIAKMKEINDIEP